MSLIPLSNTVIAREGRVVVRGTLDEIAIRQRDVGQPDPVVFSVNDGEMVFMKRPGRQGNQNSRRMPHLLGGMLPCFTSLNGLNTDDYQDYMFIGVADTAQPFNREHRMGNTGFPVQMGGFKTMHNNSQDNICAFDYVYWDYPGPNERPKTVEGTPAAKKLGVVRVFDEVNDDPMQRQRVFGRAVSYAKPGEAFDVLLGQYTL